MGYSFMGRGALHRRRVDHISLVARSMIGQYCVLGERRVSNIKSFCLNLLTLICLGIWR